jgi:hypothetical protein
MTVDTIAPAATQDMATWRRDLHAHPEFGFEERRTGAFVAVRLRALGLDEVVEGIGGSLAALPFSAMATSTPAQPDLRLRRRGASLRCRLPRSDRPPPPAHRLRGAMQRPFRLIETAPSAAFAPSERSAATIRGGHEVVGRIDGS